MTHDVAAIQRRDRYQIENSEHDVDHHDFIQQQTQGHKK